MTIPLHLQDLNEPQHQAVTSLDGPFIIFAGAGSGKTRVLTRRIAHIIHSKKALPHQILAVTFTNKAAKEMKERVAKLFNFRTDSLWISTFHSACLRILRNNAQHLGYSSNLSVYDTGDSLAVIRKILKELNLEKDFLTPKEVMDRIDRIKNDYTSPQEIAKSYSFNRLQAELFAEVYQRYQDELKKSNAMDFGDLLCKTLELFRQEKAILERYQDMFKYILVDEYQDTNHVQYLLVNLLAQKNKNLCVVGDDDQSIYAFRGANISNILSFKADYPDCTEITLNINYRSTKNILDAASTIIAKNKYRKKKQIITENSHGEKISYYCGDTDKAEANFVAKEILRLKYQGVNTSDIAVFYRTNFQSRVIEEAMLGNGINYIIYGGLPFYDRKEIKDILAYCRLTLNHKDDSAFLRIVNTPTRGIGNTTVAQLQAYATTNNLSLFEALRDLLQTRPHSFSATALKKLEVFYNIIVKLTELAKKTEKELQDASVHADQRGFVLSGFIKSISIDSGYMKMLDDEKGEESASRKENIQELMRVCEDFVIKRIKNSDDANSCISIKDFLDQSSLSSDLDQDSAENIGNSVPQSTPPVSLMTLHLAKGLEFDVVFLLGMEEGLLPHSRSLLSEDDLEEERRLCYVGITRAKKKLYLSQAMVRRSFNSGAPYSGCETSRFLMDLPPELVQYEEG